MGLTTNPFGGLPGIPGLVSTLPGETINIHPIDQIDTFDPVAAAERQWAATVAKYDFLLSKSLAELTALGYYITVDNGSVFYYTSADHNTSTAYLPIQDIQEVENARGTAGILLMHFKQPAIAKDTAGYSGGGTSAGGNPTVTDPIPVVADLPPVVDDGQGGVKFEYTGPGPTSGVPGGTETPTDNAALPGAGKKDIMPVVAAGGVVALALAGDSVTGRRTNILFAGGLGLLFYLLAKHK